MTANNSMWYNKRKRHGTLQGTDDCHKADKMAAIKNKYTTSRDRWLQLEWLNK